jgi:sigma-B regulation protein RsbU (phosphoserine phosphatase)
MLMRSDVFLLIVGTMIATLGSGAIVTYAFWRKSHQRVLLWFGLFAAPYGAILILRSSAFQLGFGAPTTFERIAERLVAFWTIIPALLLFREFYGKGWRSSLHWLIGSYIVFAVVAFALIVLQDRPDLIPSPGTGLVILVPAVLILGRFAGYRSPPLPNQRVLFGGLLFFFLAFSRDHLLNARGGVWRPGLEPYGFLILILCLGYVAAQRVVASERQLMSLTDEMRAAARIQTSILPRTLPSTENLEVAVRYAPMTAVAGDLYDFNAVHPDSIGVLVADVTGHGVPAALVASMVKIAVSTQTGRHGEPAKVITGLNSILCHEAQGQYATAVYVYLDEANRVARYSAAAHPPPLLWRRSTQTLHEFNETGLLLGVRPDEKYLEKEFMLLGGDRLLLYTDGLLEAENAAGQSFGDVVLAQFIGAQQDLGAEPFVEQLLKEVLAWSWEDGQPGQSDDITVVVIDVKEREKARA